MSAKRILVTGYRHWEDEEVIRKKLLEAWEYLGYPTDAVLVQGECPYGGADFIAKTLWESAGFTVEPHPAERDPVTNVILGKERNAKMVNLGADLCLAFLHPESRGTKNCIRLAREAGIETWVTDA